MADYCTLAEVKMLIPESGLSGSATYDNAIEYTITRVSRLIDREVGREPNYFYPSTADEVRYFDGTGDAHLWIDPAVSVTTVSLSESGGVASTDYTDLGSTDYHLWPYNYAAISSPIMRLDMDGINGSYSDFYAYPKAVKITGVFGYAATPPNDIKQACIIQAVRWYMRAKQGFADAGANAATGQLYFVQKLDPDVAEILSPYRLAGMV